MQNQALEVCEVEKNRPLSVLIVEDDDQIAYLLSFLFQRQGYEVYTATDGKQCLDVIGNQKSTDLVIMDIHLPYLNGYELVRKIRDNEAWKKTKIVMLSTKHTEKDIVHGLSIGADEFLCKPFQPNELIARVHKIMQKDGNK